MPDLLLTIVTINYNNSFGLEKTIWSIKNQICQSFEYIIVDGNSTDESVEIIKEFYRPNYKYVIEDDTGIYNAFNKGIRLSSTSCILFLNSGDELINDHAINVVLSNLNQNYFLNIFETNFIEKKKNLYITPQEIKIDFVLNNFIPHPSTIFKKDIFNKIGYFNEEFKLAGDHELFVRFFLSKYKNSYLVHTIKIVNHYLDGLSNDKNNLGIILNERKISLDCSIEDEFIKKAIYFQLEFGKFEFILKKIKKILKFILLKNG
jgi:glycosyltransferase involved in cell wall biosynthesis